jgi:hypothetical protein
MDPDTRLLQGFTDHFWFYLHSIVFVALVWSSCLGQSTTHNHSLVRVEMPSKEELQGFIEAINGFALHDDEKK